MISIRTTINGSVAGWTQILGQQVLGLLIAATVLTAATSRADESVDAYAADSVIVVAPVTDAMRIELDRMGSTFDQAAAHGGAIGGFLGQIVDERNARKLEEKRQRDMGEYADDIKAYDPRDLIAKMLVESARDSGFADAAAVGLIIDQPSPVSSKRLIAETLKQLQGRSVVVLFYDYSLAQGGLAAHLKVHARKYRRKSEKKRWKKRFERRVHYYSNINGTTTREAVVNWFTDTAQLDQQFNCAVPEVTHLLANDEAKAYKGMNTTNRPYAFKLVNDKARSLYPHLYGDYAVGAMSGILLKDFGDRYHSKSGKDLYSIGIRAQDRGLDASDYPPPTHDCAMETVETG